MNRSPSASASATKGRFRTKTQRQPIVSTTTPPTSGPSISEMVPKLASTPIAQPRRSGVTIAVA